MCHLVILALKSSVISLSLSLMCNQFSLPFSLPLAQQLKLTSPSISVRQQSANDEDDDTISVEGLLRQLATSEVQHYVSVPDCTAVQFTELCNAAHDKVRRLRVILTDSSQIAPLGRLIAASKVRMELSLSLIISLFVVNYNI